MYLMRPKWAFSQVLRPRSTKMGTNLYFAIVRVKEQGTGAAVQV